MRLVILNLVAIEHAGRADALGLSKPRADRIAPNLVSRQFISEGAGQRFKCSLGRGTHRATRYRTDRSGRTDVDDPAAPCSEALEQASIETFA